MLIYIGCGKRSEKRVRKFGVLIIHFLHCFLHLFFHSPKARSFPLKRVRVVVFSLSLSTGSEKQMML